MHHTAHNPSLPCPIHQSSQDRSLTPAKRKRISRIPRPPTHYHPCPVHLKCTCASTPTPVFDTSSSITHTPTTSTPSTTPSVALASNDSPALSEIAQLKSELAYALRLVKLAVADKNEAELRLSELQQSAHQREQFLITKLSAQKAQLTAHVRAQTARDAIFHKKSLQPDDGRGDSSCFSSRRHSSSHRIKRRSSGIVQALVQDPLIAEAALVQTRLAVFEKGGARVF